jgi:hypothetical protein
MRAILLTISMAMGLTLLSVSVFGKPAPPNRATREQIIVYTADEHIAKGIKMLMLTAYEQGYAEGYGQARLECYENEGKLKGEKS